MDELVSKRYGIALLDIAKEQQQVQQYEEELMSIKQLLTDNEDILNILSNPKVLIKNKITMMEEILKEGISREVIGLIVLLIQKGREDFIIDVIDYYVEEAKQYRGTVTAIVTSAVSLKEMQKKELISKLEENLNKKVDIIEEVEPSIIGGLKIRIGDRIIDSSIKTKMKKLTNQLSEIQMI